MTLPRIEKESKLERAVSFIASAVLSGMLVLWSVKGLEYLTQKTREARLDADYTEEMLKDYRR